MPMTYTGIPAAARFVTAVVAGVYALNSLMITVLVGTAESRRARAAAMPAE